MGTTNTSGGLARVLGPVMATAIVVGTIIGSGIFKKPQALAQELPYSGLVAIVWIVGGLLVLLGALAYAEVAVLFPRTGGNYVFLREGFGRLAGFLWGWVDFWVIRSSSVAALATIFTASLHAILASPMVYESLGLPEGGLGFWSQRVVTVGVILGLALVNIRGVRWGGGLQVVVTAVKAGSLIAIALLPWFLLGKEVDPPRVAPSPEYLQPVWPSTWSAVSTAALAAALLSVLWPYHGWMNIAPVAGEIRHPQRNIPLSLLGGVAIIVLLYLSVALAYYLAMDATEMARSKDPDIVATVFATKLLGPVGAVLISAAIMLSVFGALNGNMIVGPRLLFAMGEDGLAPRGLSTVHANYRTPAAAIAVMAAWSSVQVIVVAILLRLPEAYRVVSTQDNAFDLLTDFAMFGAVIFETMAVLAIFRFRRLLPDAPRPYRCPGYPWVPALYCIVPAFVLVGTLWHDEKRKVGLAGLSFIAAGVLVYFALGLSRTGPAAGPNE
jgi:amino acid transporter